MSKKHFKRKDNCKNIEEVIERNTGIPYNEFVKKSAPAYIPHMDEAVQTFKSHASESVYIVGDYDCDGVTASAIMYLGLKEFGVDSAVLIPRRFTDGYGLSINIVDRILNHMKSKNENTAVLITVDNGIAASQAIEKAKENGLTVIITDHHLPPVINGEVQLPLKADVIVDPCAETEMCYQDYCGAALSYYFISELLGYYNPNFTVLAGIGTVADVMKLTGPNRTLVKESLSLINNGYGPKGLRALMDALDKQAVTDSDYGFTFGPIINAAGRLEDTGATKVLATLITGRNVQDLIDNNELRKNLVKMHYKKVHDSVGLTRPIVCVADGCGEGVIGLLAGKLTEEYHCPAIVFTQAKNGLLKGSGRSIPGVHLKNILDVCQEYIVGYGGHAGAAGLSIKPESLESFTNAFVTECNHVHGTEDYSITEVEFDLALEDKYLSDLSKYLISLAPFGEGNPKIRFLTKISDLSSLKRIGDGSHIMIRNDTYTAMGFGFADEFYQELKKAQEQNNNDSCYVVGTVEVEYFRGYANTKLHISDFTFEKVEL